MSSLPNGTFDLGGFPQGFGVGDFGAFASLQNIGKSLSFASPQLPSPKFNAYIFTKLASLPSLNGVVRREMWTKTWDRTVTRHQIHALSWSRTRW
jgi:hypothetical protein